MARQIVAVAAVSLLALTLLTMRAVGSRTDDAAADPPRTTLTAPVDTVAVRVPSGRRAEETILGVHAAVPAPWGWAVLDRIGYRLAFLDVEGNLIRMTGRKGEGPGEFQMPVSLAASGDRLMVAEVSGRLVAFDSIGAWLGDVAPQPGACGLLRVVRILPGVDSLPTLSTCTSSGGRVVARVEMVSSKGSRRIVEEALVHDYSDKTLDPLRFAMMGLVGRQLAFGMAPDACLRRLALEASAETLLCYPDLPRQPTPDSVLVGFQALGERLRERGVGLTVPSHLPPFRDVLTGEGLWGFLSLPAEGGEAVDWFENDRLHRILLSEGQKLFLGRGSALLVEERMEGTAFSVVPLR